MKVFNIRCESLNFIYYVDNYKLYKLHKYYDSSKYLRNGNKLLSFN